MNMTIFQTVLFIVRSKQFGTVVKRQDIIKDLEEFTYSASYQKFSLRYLDKILRMLRASGYLLATSVRGTYLRAPKDLEDLTPDALLKKYEEAFSVNQLNNNNYDI